MLRLSLRPCTVSKLLLLWLRMLVCVRLWLYAWPVLQHMWRLPLLQMLLLWAHCQLHPVRLRDLPLRRQAQLLRLMLG